MARRRKHTTNTELKKEREQADPMAKLAPEHVFDEPEETGHSGIEVVQTFFAKHKSSYEAGVDPRSGLILNAANYVKMPRDSEGNPLVHFRWGSKRPGMPERNTTVGGFVPARVNEKGELDPNGRMVEVGGMVLLVRPIEVARARERAKEEYALRQAATRAANEIRQKAQEAGVEQHVTIRDESETVTVSNEKEA